MCYCGLAGLGSLSGGLASEAGRRIWLCASEAGRKIW